MNSSDGELSGAAPAAKQEKVYQKTRVPPREEPRSHRTPKPKIPFDQQFLKTSKRQGRTATKKRIPVSQRVMKVARSPPPQNPPKRKHAVKQGDSKKQAGTSSRNDDRSSSSEGEDDEKEVEDGDDADVPDVGGLEANDDIAAARPPNGNDFLAGPPNGNQVVEHHAPNERDEEHEREGFINLDPRQYPPGIISTEPFRRVVFNAPFDIAQTNIIKIKNLSYQRVAIGVDSLSPRIELDTCYKTLEPKESIYVQIKTKPFTIQEGLNDKVYIEYINAPEEGEVCRQWFCDATITSLRQLLVQYSL
ncbi:hypothetical protein GCK72_025314 [Caenorhabditis remanei]|uniref:Major sperm protein n=1 Tax=Caenorhabditis remanei TaxID=31234 RepID=E3MUA6_CAERE|nr:hypothetical protein GCK72_025314 [Caenorhabditis remanei]EFP09678.1 hypothetical protein CRE_21914 [Caenorhabditis remanei]KAF1748847.1 hypothetical protein GCK72_025314 [Caenorhabditis remanei]